MIRFPLRTHKPTNARRHDHQIFNWSEKLRTRVTVWSFAFLHFVFRHYFFFCRLLAMSKRYNEKRAKQAEFALNKELDSGYGKSDFEGNAALDVRDAAMGNERTNSLRKS